MKPPSPRPRAAARSTPVDEHARLARLAAVQQRIITCEACPRLRNYCRGVAIARRAAYRDWTYWGRPVPGFGDPSARTLLLGLAPAAHGANRTGRLFTGDGAGGSGDFLMAALHRAGLANRDTSDRPDDGLALSGVYIAPAVRCAPPQNKPTPEEITRCLSHLDAELACLTRLDTVVALGKIAWDAWLQLLTIKGHRLPRPKPAFGHGAIAMLDIAPLPARLVGCYHPSRQNTHTGVVTPAMYDDVFQRILRSRIVT